MGAYLLYLFIYLFITNLGEIHSWAFLSPRQYM